ncbi:hypothetical protein BUALT_Bualt03G0110400 [Buddleja alternifolia]|uniref:Wax synthase domain-containing protein n=1 Tax=Buddleja alternifolia TaxID=168488 RepID=A0AAV6XZI9_9LAMI|nr:hypothetical protein BUALT_Bualt03G0110400 [Buddleja alternifolia]
MEGEIKNLAGVWLAVIASLCYCHLISARLPKGKWRLISIIPIIYVFAILPLYLTSAFFTAVIAFFITWLANFKLLLFAFDQRPLSSNPPKSLPIFVAMAALPLKLKPKTEAPTPKRPKKLLPLYLATEIPISAILISLVYDYKQYIHPHLLMAVYCCLTFLLIEILVQLSSLLVRALTLGLELEPPSDEPYLSTSLQEFWGRRWNLTVTSTLRETVYKPVRSAATAALGRHSAALVGVVAAFLVSGLMHELLFWYVTKATPSWEMTMFFVVHGVCVVVEFELKKKRRLPWYLSGPLTVGFVAATSFWLFFPPLMRNGADAMVLQEFRSVGELVKEKIMEIWLRIIGHKSA